MLCASTAHAESVIARGGNITPLSKVAVEAQTTRWDGIVGQVVIGALPPEVNATGGNIRGITLNASAPCSVPTNVTGTILFSNSSQTISGLVAGNLTLLDQFTGGTHDAASNTFKRNESWTFGTTIPLVPTTNTYVNSTNQTRVFREGYFNDAFGNIIFAVDVDFQEPGYNLSKFDFQALLPTNNTIPVEYFVTANLNITCPPLPVPPPSFGGGGATRRCIGLWNCTAWGPCSAGIQTRVCEIAARGGCRPPAKPSQIRDCIETFPEQSLAQLIPQSEAIRELQERKLYLLVQNITAQAGARQKLNATIINPNSQSEELVRATLDLPRKYYRTRRFHKNPILYKLAGSIPYGILNPEHAWKIKAPEPVQIPPKSKKTLEISFLAPFTPPQKITGQAQAYTGDVHRASSPIEIKIDSAPIYIIHRREKKSRTATIMLITKSDKRTKAELEIDFNSKRKTKFADYLTLEIPEGVGLWSENYRTLFDYDSISARYNGKKIEVH